MEQERRTSLEPEKAPPTRVTLTDNAPKNTNEIREEEKPRETTVEFLASLAGVLVTGLFIITFVFQAFEIPSSSMEDTLLIGDHVFVNRERLLRRRSGWGRCCLIATFAVATWPCFSRLSSLDFSW